MKKSESHSPTDAARERVSAGLLLYRRKNGQIQVFLAHPGGPFFTKKDVGHWTIPKGEVEPGEDLLETALREVKEEVGIRLDRHQRFLPLGWIQQKGGKIVHAWGVESDYDDQLAAQSNLFELEWPPGSGRRQKFPEVDQARFFSCDEARSRIKATQSPFIDRLQELLQAEANSG